MPLLMLRWRDGSTASTLDVADDDDDGDDASRQVTMIGGNQPNSLYFCRSTAGNFGGDRIENSDWERYFPEDAIRLLSVLAAFISACRRELSRYHQRMGGPGARTVSLRGADYVRCVVRVDQHYFLDW
jgi:hypothetical protein